MSQATTVFVTITFADAAHWPALNQAAHHLGGVATVLQGEGPGLVSQLDELAAAGISKVLLVGVTLGAGDVPVSWIGRVARWWLAQHPDAGVELALAVAPLRALPTEPVSCAAAKTLRPNLEGLTSPSWEEAPHCHTQLLVCRGPRCTAKGAEQLINALGAELHRRGLADADVLVTQTGCLYPCNLAPVVALQPDMAWHGPLRPDDAAWLVDRIAKRNAGQCRRAQSTRFR